MHRQKILKTMCLKSQGLKQAFSGLHWTETLEIVTLTLMLSMIPFHTGISLFFTYCWFLSVVLKNSILKRWSFFSWHQDKSYPYNQNAYMLIPMLVYWLAYLISMFWTENRAAGWTEIEQNAWFFAIPVTCLCTDFRQISKKCLRAMLWAFVITLTLLFFYLLAKSIIVTQQSSSGYLTSGLKVFYDYIHHTYGSLYIVSVLAFLYTELVGEEKLGRGMLVLLALCACCLVVFLLFLNSRAGILSFILLSILCCLHTCFIRKKQRQGIISLVVVLTLLTVAYNALPEEFHRLSRTSSEIANGDMSDSRFQIMQSAWTVIKEHPLTGVGAGDRMDVLLPFYDTPKDVLCPHNQFLDTWLATGIFGLLTLCLMLAWPIQAAVKKKQVLPMLINVALLVCLLVESMFERQMGVSFTAVIYVYYSIILMK